MSAGEWLQPSARPAEQDSYRDHPEHVGCSFDEGFYCTRKAGHEGRHEAGDVNGRVVAYWVGDE